MKKIINKNQVLKLYNYPIQLCNRLLETIDILDQNYGVERNIESDLGGYILIVENAVDIQMLKQDKLKGLIPEYTDVIEVSNGRNYTTSLYLLSSDFSILVVTTEELSKLLLE
ncbi:hypothetical protein [Clostridium tertium]|uniref:hypothetical protein n=1 Tax=Clostridium tertium TaxID=1559 RepID=UPI00356299AE